MTRPSLDAIVLGAGAAGLMCAAVAGGRGRRVLVLDHAAAPGAKIVISGGGRCNFTNLHTAPDRFLSANPRFATSALSRYGPLDFLALVERHGIGWHEKTLGQLFCDGRATQIVAMLLDECAGGGARIETGVAIEAVDHADGRFRVRAGGREHVAPALVVATGGPSIPKIGGSDLAYRIARRFGLKVVEPRPALVPLTLGPDDALFRDLAGVSAPIAARCAGAVFREAALFTHRGLSGPAMLQVSSYWRRPAEVAVDFLPDAPRDWLVAEKRARPRAGLRATLARTLPDRLADALAERLDCAGELANLPDARLRAAAARLADWRFRPTGTEGYAKAEVTVGGVATDALSSRTMAARAVPGLYVVGEAADVTGWLGGYNFQWAWASGVAAGEAI